VAVELLRFARPLIRRGLGEDWVGDARGIEPAQAEDNIVLAFVRTSVPWSRVAVPLPSRLRGALIALLLTDLAWGIWLAVILTGRASCHGPICEAATLHHQVWLLAACSSVCVVGLIATGLVTRAFTRCDGRGVVGIAVATVAGWVSLLGIAALLSGLVIVLIVLLAIALGFSSTS
jgi:hypothetical protein